MKDLVLKIGAQLKNQVNQLAELENVISLDLCKNFLEVFFIFFSDFNMIFATIKKTKATIRLLNVIKTNKVFIILILDLNENDVRKKLEF